MTDTRFTTILKRGVAEIITEAELVRLLNSGRILTLKQGFDPSAPDIHLGHVVGLRKLRQLQELGHKVTLIVGDWTARIGDPSGQSTTRPMLSPREIEINAQTYMEQFFKVVDKDKTELRWQSEWFSRFTLDEVIKLTSKFTIAQLLAREAIQADVEFGGIDQKFNCLVGRELQQSTGQSPQQIFLVPLLVGTDGHQKMSKSLNNHIGIAEPPREIYGKVMSIPDSLIVDYFELVTDVAEEEITEFKKQLKTRSVNPMNLKKRLAHEIVRQFHGKQAADEAQEETHTVELRGIVDISGKFEVEVQRDITSLIVEAGLAKSRSEANRLLAQGAIEVDGEKVSTSLVTLKDGSIIKVGKRRFLRIVDSMKKKQETASS